MTMEQAIQEAGNLGRQAANQAANHYLGKLDRMAIKHAMASNAYAEDESDVTDDDEYYAAMEEMADEFLKAFEQNWYGPAGGY